MNLSLSRRLRREFPSPVCDDPFNFILDTVVKTPSTSGISGADRARGGIAEALDTWSRASENGRRVLRCPYCSFSVGLISCRKGWDSQPRTLKQVRRSQRRHLVDCKQRQLNGICGPPEPLKRGPKARTDVQARRRAQKAEYQKRRYFLQVQSRNSRRHLLIILCEAVNCVKSSRQI